MDVTSYCLLSSSQEPSKCLLNSKQVFFPIAFSFKKAHILLFCTSLLNIFFSFILTLSLNCKDATRLKQFLGH